MPEKNYENIQGLISSKKKKSIYEYYIKKILSKIFFILIKILT